MVYDQSQNTTSIKQRLGLAPQYSECFACEDRVNQFWKQQQKQFVKYVIHTDKTQRVIFQQTLDATNVIDTTPSMS